MSREDHITSLTVFGRHSHSDKHTSVSYPLQMAKVLVVRSYSHVRGIVVMSGNAESSAHERDQAAIDALLAPYKGTLYAQLPDDPRILDTERLKSIRDRLTDKYYYRWREKDANGELVDALYSAVAQTDGTRYALCTSDILLNNDGMSPGPFRMWDDREFRRYYYITVCSQNVRPFIAEYDAALTLQRSVLPDWGVTVRDWPGSMISVRLENCDRHEKWVTGDSVPLTIVVATLDHLISCPEDAAPWRSI